MSAIQGFLSGYSGNFKAALLAWPFVSFVLTLPILAYLYHRDGRLKATSFLAAYLAVLYALGIVCFTLYPLPEGESGPGITYGVPAQWNPVGFIFDIGKDGLRAVFQLAFNIVFFVPLGFIAGRLLRMRFATAALLALGVSVCIEFAQLTGLFGIYPYAYRCCDVDDVLCNALGGALGWLGARALGSRTADEVAEPAIDRHPGLVRRIVALWIDFLIINVAAGLPWLMMSLAWELLLDQPYRLFGLSPEQTMALVVGSMGIAAFVVVECVVPWTHAGSTPAGLFVRMTIESHERAFANRLLFYLLRTVALIALVCVPFVMVPLLGLYYLAKRCMPYDQVP